MASPQYQQLLLFWNESGWGEIVVEDEGGERPSIREIIDVQVLRTASCGHHAKSRISGECPAKERQQTLTIRGAIDHRIVVAAAIHSAGT